MWSIKKVKDPSMSSDHPSWYNWITNTITITIMDNCISCENIVRPRQQAMQCDSCRRWQHRTCGTGISQQQYREAVNNGGTIDISKFHLPPRNFRTSARKFWLNGSHPYSRLKRSTAKFSLCVRRKNACYSKNWIISQVKSQILFGG